MKYTTGLKKKADFTRVYQSGRSRADKRLVLYVLENGTPENRIGISVSKKVGNSVVRHRLKRVIKEAYRLNEECCSSGWDLVVIARAGQKEASYRDLERSLLRLLAAQGVINKEV